MGYYTAILDGSRDVWGVRFPDFPGCHGGGQTPDAAIADATSALREFAAMMVADGEPIPAARTLDELGSDERPGRSEYLVMIPLILDRGRPVKANISLDAGLLEAIDREAERRGLTRSAFLVSAAIDKIETPANLRVAEIGNSDSGGFAESGARPLKARRGTGRRR
jgi:predicted RNase H-like HicB family nuclease